MGFPRSVRAGAAAPAGVGPKPERRPKIYVPHAARSEPARIGLPNSPSLGTSTPAFTWLDTTPATDVRSSSCSRRSSSRPCVGFDQASIRASGRGRLPAWVVRMRSVLRSMNSLRSKTFYLGDNIGTRRAVAAPGNVAVGSHEHIPALEQRLAFGRQVFRVEEHEVASEEIQR